MSGSEYKIKDLLAFIKKELNPVYSEGEIESLIPLIFKHVFNYSNLDIYLNNQIQSSDLKIRKFREMIKQLKNEVPIQYITGKAEFLDITLNIKPGIFIPRPETEEIVQYVIMHSDKKVPEILDIGTGSGNIAITLAKNIDGSMVDAIDISEEALKIASQNAKNNMADVNYFQMDIHKHHKYSIQKKYDIIISNPPYVKESEKPGMSKNVLSNEPINAIFVPDKNPLIFYKAIVEFAETHLKRGGWIYLEINEKLASETSLLLKKFNDILIIKDINGKDRMVCGQIQNF